jgi:hypothetical protein
MKTLLAITLIVGLPFAGFCGTTNETNNASQTQSEQLLSRHYKITAETFVSNLKNLAGTKEGESNIQILLRFFKQNRIEIKNPESIFWNERINQLFVRATEVHQHKIEQIVEAIQDNVPPSEIHN